MNEPETDVLMRQWYDLGLEKAATLLRDEIDDLVNCDPPRAARYIAGLRQAIDLLKTEDNRLRNLRLT